MGVLPVPAVDAEVSCRDAIVDSIFDKPTLLLWVALPGYSMHASHDKVRVCAGAILAEQNCAGLPQAGQACHCGYQHAGVHD